MAPGEVRAEVQGKTTAFDEPYNICVFPWYPILRHVPGVTLSIDCMYSFHSHAMHTFKNGGWDC